MFQTNDGVSFNVASSVVHRIAALPFVDAHQARENYLTPISSEIPGLLYSAHSDSVFREGMLFAAPTLWRRFVELLSASHSPFTGQERSVVDAVMRYVLRARSRSTPFGLFAGVGTSTVRDTASPIFVEESRRWKFRVRPDFGWMQGTMDGVRSSYEAQSTARLRVPPLARLDGAYLLTVREDVGGIFSSVRVPLSDPLRSLYNSASSGWTTRSALENVVLSHGYSPQSVQPFIDECLTFGVLESDFALAQIGEEPAVFALQRLQTVAAHQELQAPLELLRVVTSVQSQLDLDAVSAVRCRVSEHDNQSEANNTLQCDAFVRATEGEVPLKALGQLFRAADAVRAMSRHSDPLQDFKERFRTRYEDATVPLLEALDPDLGIGLGRILKTPRAENDETVRVVRHLSSLITRSVRNGHDSVDIDRAFVDAISTPSAQSYGSSFALQAVLFKEAWSGNSTTANPIAWLCSIIPAPATAFLGRFTHDNGSVAELAKRLAGDDARALAPALAAEVAYLPKGRSGNVLWRGSLYDACIPLNAVRVADGIEQICPRELVLRFSNKNLILWSTRLNCEIIPRLSVAHAFDRVSSLPLYRFLCMLQFQQQAGYMRFSWHELRDAVFLPRVSYENVVLSPALWRLDLTKNVPQAIEVARKKENLPRHVLCGEGDNLIAVDLDDPVQVRAVLKPSRTRNVCLRELLPNCTDDAVRSERGSHRSEFVIPFVRVASREPHVQGGMRDLGPVPETFRPGSDWIYVRVYAGSALHDEVLLNLIGPLVRELTQQGVVEQWFFLRYADPEPHVRIRLRTKATSRLRKSAFGEIAAALETRVASFGGISRTVYDTYVPELDRYGWRGSMEHAHAVFSADSDCALTLLHTLDVDDRDVVHTSMGKREAGGWSFRAV